MPRHLGTLHVKHIPGSPVVTIKFQTLLRGLHHLCNLHFPGSWDSPSCPGQPAGLGVRQICPAFLPFLRLFPPCHPSLLRKASRPSNSHPARLLLHEVLCAAAHRRLAPPNFLSTDCHVTCFHGIALLLVCPTSGSGGYWRARIMSFSSHTVISPVPFGRSGWKSHS